jgi:dienelactone hydrolase
VKSFRILCCFAAGLLMAQPAGDPGATARKALDLLLAEKYTELAPLFTPDMQKAYPADALAKLRVSFGPLKGIDNASVQPMGANTVVIIPAHFEAHNYNFRFIINKEGLVSGMFPLAGEAAWQHPSYSKADAFHERDVTIGNDQWKLPGTLTLPKGDGPFAAVVLVHPSGANDRDATKGAGKPFKDLAEGLASRGIAVLRYEKRTQLYRGVKPASVDEETVTDAARAVALLRTQKEIDGRRVYLLGYGLGGYVAPRIAEEDGKLAGIILFAANARPIEDVALDQAQYLGVSAKDLEGIKAAVKRVKALDPADTDAPPLLGMPVTYLLDLKSYDPVGSLKAEAIPVLVLQGERDFESNMKDFALWKAGLGTRKDATFQSYPSLNHLFIAGEGKGGELEYRKPGHVAPEVIDTIAKWIK